MRFVRVVFSYLICLVACHGMPDEDDWLDMQLQAAERSAASSSQSATVSIPQVLGPASDGPSMRCVVQVEAPAKALSGALRATATAKASSRKSSAGKTKAKAKAKNATQQCPRSAQPIRSPAWKRGVNEPVRFARDARGAQTRKAKMATLFSGAGPEAPATGFIEMPTSFLFTCDCTETSYRFFKANDSLGGGHFVDAREFMAQIDTPAPCTGSPSAESWSARAISTCL